MRSTFAALALRLRVARLPREPQEVPLVVRARTRDGDELIVLATLAFQITDPEHATRVPDVDVTTATLAEELAAQAFAHLTVDQVRDCPAALLDDVVAEVSARSVIWGVTAQSLRIDEIDLRLAGPA
ncbi:hypothetical protein EFK50_02005 [Nocardioides marmoriginsengisoli]|uniref:Band 7 domain-containing protein n=1 Tax=Nocardioides marmoriginsengisoli TaxID=661483 RepID=A0A3N0CPH1_9ACTN|nr:hypothetical protein [Nocardioides marmoriginsengisoli]RNL64793.1 hypothetical protein EFK50_02005 [Nocardioides marmoriginsengisoli]